MRRHISFAWQKAVYTMLLGGVMAWVIVFVGNWVNTHSASFDPRTLVLREISFKDGAFHQMVVPVGSEIVQGTWAAQIADAGGGFICGGGDVAPYRPRVIPAVLDPDEWTDDECDMVDGALYTATASWEWYDSRGLSKSISTSFQFTYSPRGDS